LKERLAMARKWWTLTAVCVGVFMLLLDVTIVNVALPDIQNRFHASLSDLQWVIDAQERTHDDAAPAEDSTIPAPARP